MAARRLTAAILFGAVVLLSGCDLATKEVARSQLRGQPSIDLVSGVLRLTYVENRDTGFGLLRFIPTSGRRPLIVGLQLLTIGVVLLLWWRSESADQAARRSLLRHLPFVLLLAGAAGNLVERIARGYVVDFIHLRYWPVFNLADILIVAGGVLLFLTWRRAAPAASSS
jgi:signal peptidase II